MSSFLFSKDVISEDNTGFFTHNPATGNDNILKQYPELEQELTASGNQWVSLTTMESNLALYSSLDAFQADLDSCINTAFKCFTKEHQIFQTATRLSSIGIGLVNMVAKRIGKPQDGGASQKRKHSSATGQEKDLNDLEERNTRKQKVALVQRTADGSYLFSSGQLGTLVANPDAVLDKGYSKVKIVPTTALAVDELPNLAFASKPLKKPSSMLNKDKKGISIESVDFINYGPFMSFAPSYDSSRATLNAVQSSIVHQGPKKISYAYVDNLYTGYPSNSLICDLTKESKGKTPIHVPHKSNLSGSTPSVISPVAWIELQKLIAANDSATSTSVNEASLSSLAAIASDIEWTKLSQLPKQIESVLSHDPIDVQHASVDSILSQNKSLLAKLQQLQSERIQKAAKHGSSRSSTVSIDEWSTAQLLQRNLLALSKRVAPKHLVSKEGLENAWKALEVYTGVNNPGGSGGFKGTLFVHKPFAFVSDECGVPKFPDNVCVASVATVHNTGNNA